MELRDVPLEVRCEGAVAVIWQDPHLDRRGRRELLAAAIWPSHAQTPGAHARSPAELSRSSRGLSEPPSRRRRLPPEQPSTPEQRAEARRLLAAGWTITQIAEHLHQPWHAVQGWIRAKGG